jgi:hypothetical protein
LNPHQPQTMQYAVLLGYVECVLGLLGGWLGDAPMVLALVAIGVGSFGIANEKKWGYAAACAGAGGRVLLLLAYWGSDALQDVFKLIVFMFAVALLGLLVHPMSRDYQRIWFK